MIPYGRQNISPQDINAVQEILAGPFLTQGPAVRQFEAALEAYVGCSKAVVTNSATSALHLACLALGVGPDDSVWTTAISFVASANAARYCGADVDFVDIEPDSFNISVAALEQKLREAREAGGKLPKVVIPVAMAGQSSNMKEIAELSGEYGFKILEDASHALGATYRGARVGSCEFSDITVFSFHPVKMITTGEGGACVTNNLELGAKIERLRSHGITRQVSEMESPNSTPYYYEQLDLGYNYRMTDFQAALGASQLKRLDQFVAARNEIASLYSSLLDLPWVALPEITDECNSSFHLYIIRIQDGAPRTRDQIFEAMRSNGILVNVHYIPIYRHPYYSRMGKYNPEDFPFAEEYYKQAISLPIFPGIKRSDLDSVVSSLVEGIGHQTIF